ncbi:hypothetical protein BDN67DRAFT_1017089 [Paxillus ammoniavirescens]|nr:hypothetical protein BDN67DRAFT_1017089 [Paxillus ammoniavirescens]
MSRKMIAHDWGPVIGTHARCHLHINASISACHNVGGTMQTKPDLARDFIMENQGWLHLLSPTSVDRAERGLLGVIMTNPIAASIVAPTHVSLPGPTPSKKAAEAITALSFKTPLSMLSPLTLQLIQSTVQSPLLEVLPAGDLDSIPKLNEPYDFTAYDVDAVGFPNPSQLREMTEFLSAFTGSGESDTEVDGYNMKSQEDFNLGSLTSTDKETRSDSESALSAPAKQTKPIVSTGKGKVSMKPEYPYNPESCNDKLNIFKERMRLIIVPPRLANGKASTQSLKNVVVYFEDASAKDSSPTHISTGNNNKAGTKGSGSGSSLKQKSLAASGELKGTDQQEKLIKALQKWWMSVFNLNELNHSNSSEVPASEPPFQKHF